MNSAARTHRNGWFQRKPLHRRPRPVYGRRLEIKVHEECRQIEAVQEIAATGVPPRGDAEVDVLPTVPTAEVVRSLEIAEADESLCSRWQRAELNNRTEV